ncbi:hypothetical protein GCM10011581_18420 [Saccharopolyspora subtropica]|uniref:Uncharacterized protein n=1 Tax=Saccharopolyspora thermophila TaxID=89367 RepID=A0A917JS78_9PSEU|nr:hypothetical protein [Saccharopolyspora subtropica]GGI81331.1 hypothetical protein GCM10011581_18420 [Saccharopolyspora subtropica]
MVRFGYVLEAVSTGAEVVEIARKPVDPEQRDPELLRQELRPWAEAELVRSKAEFGLYTAEFGSWGDGRSGFYLRMLYIVWGGDDVISAHVDDSPVNYAGVRALANQAEAFRVLRKAERQHVVRAGGHERLMAR